MRQTSGVASPERGTRAVSARAKRALSAQYRARIVAEHDSLGSSGRGALLRREGLYSADVDAWRGGPEPPPADAPAPPPAPPPGPPPARKTRRRSPEQKLSILKQWEAADASGRAALKLREKVGVSHITAWRRARDAAALEALADRRLGPRRADADKLRIAELESANRRLADELDTARQVVKTQGKLVALLEQLPPNCATPPTGSGPVRR